MTTQDEVREGLTIARAALDAMEARLSNDDFDAEGALIAIKKIVGAVMSYGRPVRGAGNPGRGVGYDLDEAMIVASLPWFKEIMSAAIRAHFPHADHERVVTIAERIRRRQREIQELDGDSPWERSTNWLGGLLPE